MIKISTALSDIYVVNNILCFNWPFDIYRDHEVFIVAAKRGKSNPRSNPSSDCKKVFYILPRNLI